MKKALLTLTLLLLAVASLRAQLIFSDNLDYPDGSITTNSSGLWIRHSGTSLDSLEVNHRYEVNANRQDDIHRFFDPVNTNGVSSTVLYASFVMRMTNLPTSALGTYFAHFNDVLTNEHRCRIFALVTNAMTGTYRVGIANAASDGATTIHAFPMDLVTNVDYQIVVSYDPFAAGATLWVNPAAEGDPNVQSTDSGTVSNALTGFCFRQSAGEGVSQIKNLRVATNNFTDVVIAPTLPPVIALQPAAITNFSGNNASMLVLASGRGALTYTWYHDNSAVPGGTSQLLSFTPLAGGDQGNYYCAVSNSAGGVNTITNFVSVNSTPTPPTFLTQPQSITNAAGSSVSFTANVVGTGPLVYTWSKGSALSDGGNISGSSTATLTLSPIASADAGSYTLTVSGGVGSPVASTPAVLTVLPPAILISKGNYTQNFDTLATSGTANTWSDGVTLLGWYASQTKVGGTVLTYRGDTGLGSAGALYSYGTNGANPVTDRALGSLASGTPGNFAYGVLFFNDTVNIATNITISYTGEQWRSTNATPQNLSFSYRISSSAITNSDASSNQIWTAFPALSFTSPNLGNLNNALDGNLSGNRTVFSNVSLPGVQLAPGQEIFFRWFDVDDGGSDNALALDDLSVNFTTVTAPTGPPIITSQPQSLTNNAGTTAVFSIGITGAFPQTYQWKHGATDLTEGGRISGSTNATLTITGVLAADAGPYSVFVTNAVGNTNASVALTVNDPVVTTQPSSVTNLLGDNANFFAAAAGTAPLTYQWLSNGVPISGATANALNLPVTSSSALASYAVMVTSGASGNPSTNSNAATITLIPSPALKVATWDFNSNPADANTNTGSLTPITGTGTVNLVGGTTAAFQPGTFADPATDGNDNSAWNTTGYPVAGTGERTAGIVFTADTTGYQDILVSWEQRNSATASKYTCLQYTINGSTWINWTTNTMNVGASLPFQLFTSDLSSIPGVNNNPNFGFRIVTVFGPGGDYVPTNPGSYGAGGTMRYDWVNVFGNTFVPSVTLNSTRPDSTHIQFSWTDGAYILQGAPLVTGTYTNVTGGGTSPVTVPLTNAQGYFRLFKP